MNEMKSLVSKRILISTTTWLGETDIPIIGTASISGNEETYLIVNSLKLEQTKEVKQSAAKERRNQKTVLRFIQTVKGMSEMLQVVRVYVLERKKGTKSTGKLCK
jgi:hypothetical protein